MSERKEDRRIISLHWPNMAGQTGEIFAAAAAIVFLVVSSTCADNYKYEVKTFNAKIDHFTFTSTKTFPLRYLVNSTWWDPSSHVSPIFFYTGNEGDIETFAQNTGLMWELARSFDALIVFAEHRYYGKSLPFGNLSYSDPKYSGYLSSAQALADYIDLIQHLKEVYPKKDPQAHRTPVIAFGGSYGGMLAAWIRMKYPGIITGSLASSAPIFQFTNMTNCDDFNRIVTSAYRDIGSTKCADNIKKSWASINELAKTDDGKKWLNQTFKPCQQPLDAASLKDWLTNMYVNIAMVNYPYPANFLAPLPAWPVKAVCEVIGGANQSDKPLLEAVSKATTLYFNSTGSLKCNDMNSQGSSGVDVDGWDYQSCTEMVMPLCDNGDTMFEATKWDINALSKQCLSKWKVTPDVNYVQNLYGGKEVASVSNIIFSNGLLDPWSGGGVLYNMSSSAISVILPEAAHHLDLRATNKLDPHSIRRARKLYRTIFKRWVSAFSFSQE